MSTSKINRKMGRRALLQGAGAAALWPLFPRSAASQVAGEQDEIIEGGRASIAGAWVFTWARVSKYGKVKQVGAAIPLEMA